MYKKRPFAGGQNKPNQTQSKPISLTILSTEQGRQLQKKGSKTGFWLFQPFFFLIDCRNAHKEEKRLFFAKNLSIIQF